MPEDFRLRPRRHLGVVLSFMFGMAFGISILALAFFSTRNEIAARVLRFGVQATGHTDIDEDLIWLFCGIVIGASVACVAWWRDNQARKAGLEDADIMNRLFTDPESKPPRMPKIPG
jgi:glycopeptide antibiotics resistance protein